MNDADCGANERCEFGYCQPFSCSVDSDCDNTFECVAGRCILGPYCMTDAECPAPSTCVNFVCQNPGGCTSDSQCPVGQSCYAGGCYTLPPIECNRDVDCAFDEVCDFGICNPANPPLACQINSDCRDRELCIGGVCQRGVECLDDTDCNFPQVCISDQCVDPGCTRDGQCPAGESCVMGACQ